MNNIAFLLHACNHIFLESSVTVKVSETYFLQQGTTHEIDVFPEVSLGAFKGLFLSRLSSYGALDHFDFIGFMAQLFSTRMTIRFLSLPYL